MGVKFVAWFPSCEELVYLHKILILIRMFGRLTRNTITCLLTALLKNGIYDDQNESSVSV